MGRFITAVALSLSVIAVGMSGYCIYKVDRLEQTQSLQRLSTEPVPSNLVNANTSTPPANSTMPADTLPTTTASTTMHEAEESHESAAPITVTGKLAKNQGDIQVLSVKRIADPYTKLRNVVNGALENRKQAAKKWAQTSATFTWHKRPHAIRKPARSSSCGAARMTMVAVKRNTPMSLI
jgi:hypothetical protein